MNAILSFQCNLNYFLPIATSNEGPDFGAMDILVVVRSRSYASYP